MNNLTRKALMSATLGGLTCAHAINAQTIPAPTNLKVAPKATDALFTCSLPATGNYILNVFTNQSTGDVLEWGTGSTNKSLTFTYAVNPARVPLPAETTYNGLVYAISNNMVSAGVPLSFTTLPLAPADIKITSLTPTYAAFGFTNPVGNTAQCWITNTVTGVWRNFGSALEGESTPNFTMGTEPIGPLTPGTLYNAGFQIQSGGVSSATTPFSFYTPPTPAAPSALQFVGAYETNGDTIGIFTWGNTIAGYTNALHEGVQSGHYTVNVDAGSADTAEIKLFQGQTNYLAVTTENSAPSAELQVVAPSYGTPFPPDGTALLDENKNPVGSLHNPVIGWNPSKTLSPQVTYSCLVEMTDYNMTWRQQIGDIATGTNVDTRIDSIWLEEGKDWLMTPFAINTVSGKISAPGETLRYYSAPPKLQITTTYAKAGNGGQQFTTRSVCDVPSKFSDQPADFRLWRSSSVLGAWEEYGWTQYPQTATDGYRRAEVDATDLHPLAPQCFYRAGYSTNGTVVPSAMVKNLKTNLPSVIFSTPTNSPVGLSH